MAEPETLPTSRTTPDSSLAPLRSLQSAVQDGRLVAAVRRREHGAALTKAQRALASFGGSVDRLEELARIAATVVTHIDKPGQTELRRKLGMLAQKGHSLVGEITTETLDNSWRQLEDIDDLAKDISTQLQRAWDILIQAEFGTLAQLGDALKAMKAEPELGERMRAIAREGLALRASFPPSVTALEALVKHIQARDEARDKLSKSGSGIGVFLLKVAKGQATLADLDQETLDWLRKQGAMQAFAVRL
jgi:hypothetical protein